MNKIELLAPAGNLVKSKDCDFIWSGCRIYWWKTI